MSHSTVSRLELSHIVEKQMRQWELSQSQRPVDRPPPEPQSRIDYVTISRELGSGGEQVAQILGELLGWDVYDKQVLNLMAEDLHVHERLIAGVDEKTVSWIEEFLGSIPSAGNHVSQYCYFTHLTRVLLVIARHGKAIIVGRAAGLVLPREHGLSIRITAPLASRAATVAQQRRISEPEARKQVEQADREQRKFVKEYLHRDFRDAGHYDLTVNTDRFGPRSVAKLIWRALDQRQAT